MKPVKYPVGRYYLKKAFRHNKVQYCSDGVFCGVFGLFRQNATNPEGVNIRSRGWAKVKSPPCPHGSVPALRTRRTNTPGGRSIPGPF